jgi:site-specific DNA-cytosine methylase
MPQRRRPASDGDRDRALRNGGAGDPADGANRARDVADPLPTLTTANRGEQALIEGTAQYDILFRMLGPHELAAAMGFNDAEREYEFTGTKTQKIKQIGNAVSVSKMRACVKAIMSDAAKKPARELIVQRGRNDLVSLVPQATGVRFFACRSEHVPAGS